MTRNTPSDKRLVLFDIDGTLISTNGDGVRAMMEAYTAIWGKDPTDVPYSMSGKTELGISHELLALMGFTRAQVEEKIHHFWEDYPRMLTHHLSPERTVVHPGIREALAAVAAHPDMVLGLLTGNCEAAAQVKMEVAGLEGFELGAYGAHHEHREELPPIAVEEALRHTGHHFSGKSIVIIGDTPNDIRCGRGVGARSIAVATGRIPTSTLRQHHPDYCFENLADTGALMDAILN